MKTPPEPIRRCPPWGFDIFLLAGMQSCAHGKRTIKKSMIYQLKQWSMVICGNLCWSMVICGNLWWCMVICGNLWWCMVICGNLWWCMVICGNLWWCMVIVMDIYSNNGDLWCFAMEHKWKIDNLLMFALENRCHCQRLKKYEKLNYYFQTLWFYMAMLPEGKSRGYPIKVSVQNLV